MKTMLALAALAAAAPAFALTPLTIDFSGAGAPAASLTRTVSGVTFTAEGRIADAGLLPGNLSALADINTAADLSRSAPGIGVVDGASGPQLDTNGIGRREGVLLTASTDRFRLLGLKLSFIDNDDTLQVYGVQGNTLVSLGYPGFIRQGGPNGAAGLLAGQATGPAFSAANDGTQVLDLVNPTGYFEGFFFTTREPGNLPFGGGTGQGYRIDKLTVAVPEPATWALLITGFSLVGFAARRRRGLPVVAA